MIAIRRSKQWFYYGRGRTYLILAAFKLCLVWMKEANDDIN
jgi:hypothetical protein